MNGLHAVLTIASGRRAKWAVLVFWLVMLGVFGSLSAKLTGAEQNNIQAWLPGSAQSTKVLALEARLQSPNIFTAVVVYDRPASGGGFLPLTSADRAKATADARQFASVPGVVKSQIAGPIAAANGKAVETIVPVNLGSKGYDGASTAADRLRAISLADAGGLASHIAGPLGNAADSASAFSGISGTLLGATLGVVIVLLLLTYRSPVLWLLPVISAAAALSTSEGVVYLLTKYLTVNAQSAGILDVLVFGASTDYALLLTARYREELRRHEDRHEAMAIALRRAGPAIIASAATVIASLLTLSAADLNSTKDMGPVLAIGVAVALMAMLTLLPALLVICGRWVFWPARPAFGTEEPSSRGLWARTGGLIARRPRAVWLATVLVLGAMAVGLTGLKASGLTNAQTFRGHPDSVTGQTVIDQNFPAAAGDGAPVQVVANAAQAAPVAAAFRAVPGITAVTAPVTVDGHAYLNGTLTVPPDSQAAYATVDRVRAATSAVPGADAQVGGTSATSLDVQQANTHDREVIIPVILAVVLVILMLLLRAGRAGHADRHRGAVVPRRARRQLAVLQPRVRLRWRGRLVPAAGVRLPRLARHRLQHLPDDPGPRGNSTARRPAGRAHRPGGHRRGDRLGRPGARRDVRRTRHAAAHDDDRTRVRRRVRRTAGHDRGQVRPGDRAQPGPGALGMVAERAGAQSRPSIRPAGRAALAGAVTDAAT